MRTTFVGSACTFAVRSSVSGTACCVTFTYRTGLAFGFSLGDAADGFWPAERVQPARDSSTPATARSEPTKQKFRSDMTFVQRSNGTVVDTSREQRMRAPGELHVTRSREKRTDGSPRAGRSARLKWRQRGVQRGGARPRKERRSEDVKRRDADDVTLRAMVSGA